MQKQLPNDVLAKWNSVPGRMRRAIRGLNEHDLDRRGGEHGWSAREVVHHLVEANLIASNMIIAALATDGGKFDWTWVKPNGDWMRRVGYSNADIVPALNLLRALTRHVTEIVGNRPDALKRKILLNDAPGTRRYPMTVAEVLGQEIEHAAGHLADLRSFVGEKGAARRSARAA